MKREFALSAVCVSLLSLLLFSSHLNAELSKLESGEDKAILKVEKMSWTACVVAVRNSLRKLEGVEYVEVDYDAEEAIVIYLPEVVSTRAMMQATANIGFPSTEK